MFLKSCLVGHMRDSAQWDLISVNLRGPRLPRVTPPSTRAAARHDQTSVSQSVISRSRPALRPLSDVRPLSPSQRTAPLPPVERGPNSLMRSRVKAAWFFEWNSIWWNWSAPLVRRWYAACAGNRALAVTRLDDHFFQGLLWARRLNLGRGPSSPAPSPDTSPGRTKSFSDFRWT